MARIMELYFARVKEDNGKLIFSTQKFTELSEVWNTLRNISLKSNWVIVILKQDAFGVYNLEERPAREL